MLGKLLESRRLFIAVVAFLMLPVVCALGVDLSLRETRAPAVGDLAALELRVLDATRGGLQLGAYSRFGWQHPGPAYLYVLAPLYAVAGKAPWALHTGAALLYALFLALIVREVVLLFVEQRVRLAALGPLSILFFDTSLASIPSGITEPWNPIVPVVPFTLLVLVCARMTQGQLQLLPYAVLLHAIVAQAHLGYVPLASAALGFGAFIGLLRRDRGAADSFPLRSLFLTGLAGFLCWMLPLIDQIWGTHNLSRIARFAVRAEGQPANAIPGLFLEPLGRPLASLITLDRDSGGEALAVTCGVALLVGVCALALWARRKRLPAPFLGFVLGLYPFAALSVMRIEGEPHEYLTLWLGVIGMVGASVCAARVATLADKLGVTLAALGAGLAALTGTAGSVLMLSRHTEYARARSEERERMQAAVREAERFRNRAPKEPILLLVADNDAWDEAAMLAVTWEKRGVRLLLDPRYQFLFGPRRAYASTLGRELSLGTRMRHDRPLFSHVRGLFLYGSDRTDTDTRKATPPRVRAAEHVKGNAAAVIDGWRPREGSPWDTQGAVILENTDAYLTLEQTLSLTHGVELVADGNDSFKVEASVDGNRWEQWLEVPPVAGWGLRRRHAKAPRPRPVAFVRIKAAGGDGSFSIAEIALDTGRPAVAVVAARGVQGDLALVSDGEAPPDGSPWDATGSVSLLPDGEIELLAPKPGVGGFEVAGDGNDVLIVHAVGPAGERVRLGEMEDKQRFGIQRRRFWVNGVPLERFVLSVGRTDKLISIAEIVPFVGQQTLIDVGSPSARQALGSGWSGDEVDSAGATFRWIDGTHATVSYTTPRDTEHRVTLRAWPHQIDGRPQRLRARVGDRTLLDVELRPGPQEPSFRVPAELARGQVQLVLELAWAVSPAALGLSGDPRKLSMGVDTISVVWD